MKMRDSMVSDVLCAIWDHPERLALSAPHSSLITKGFRWTTLEIPYTHVDPWVGLLSQAPGVSEKNLELRVRLDL